MAGSIPAAAEGLWRLRGGTEVSGDLPTEQSTDIPYKAGQEATTWMLPLELAEKWERRESVLQEPSPVRFLIELADGSRLGARTVEFQDDFFRVGSAWGQELELIRDGVARIAILPIGDDLLAPAGLRASDWRPSPNGIAAPRLIAGMLIPQTAHDTRLARQLPADQALRIDLWIRSVNRPPSFSMQVHSTQEANAGRGMIQISFYEGQVRVYHPDSPTNPPEELTARMPEGTGYDLRIEVYSDPLRGYHEVWLNGKRMHRWRRPSITPSTPGPWFNLLMGGGIQYVIEDFRVSRWDGQPRIELPATPPAAGMVRLNLANGDVQEGKLESWDADTLNLRTADGTRISLPLRLVSRVEQGIEPVKSMLPRWELAGGGNRLWLSLEEWGESALRLRGPYWRGDLLIPREWVDIVRFPESTAAPPFVLKLANGNRIPANPLRLSEQTLTADVYGRLLDVPLSLLRGLESVAQNDPPAMGHPLIHLRGGGILVGDRVELQQESLRMQRLDGTLAEMPAGRVEIISLAAKGQPGWVTGLHPLEPWIRTNPAGGRPQAIQVLGNGGVSIPPGAEWWRPLPAFTQPMVVRARVRSTIAPSFQISPLENRVPVRTWPGLIVTKDFALLMGVSSTPMLFPRAADGIYTIEMRLSPQGGPGSVHVNGQEFYTWEKMELPLPEKPWLLFRALGDGVVLEEISCMPASEPLIREEQGRWVAVGMDTQRRVAETARIADATLVINDQAIPIQEISHILPLHADPAQEGVKFSVRVTATSGPEILPLSDLTADEEGIRGNILGVTGHIHAPWSAIQRLEFATP